MKLTDQPTACNNLTNFGWNSDPPETEVDVNLLGKTREMTSMELTLWRVLAIWNQCASSLRLCCTGLLTRTVIDNAG